MNADGSNQTRLTSDPASDKIPTWSPDGKKIAFQSNRDGKWGVYVMDADGSNQKKLADGWAPAWSPSGRAPDFSLPTLDGNTITLSNYRGKIILLNFWVALPSTRIELPVLQQAYDKWPKDKYVMLTINVKESDKDVQLFVTKNGLTLPVLLDKTGDVAAMYGVTARPTSFLIDSRGIIREIKLRPFRTVEEVSESLNKID